MIEHVERRAGQRWRSDRPLGGRPYVIEGTLGRREYFGGSLGLGWCLTGVTLNGAPKPDGEYVFYDPALEDAP